MSDLREFISAVKSGYLDDVVERFRKEYINAKLNGLTALHYACMSNNNSNGDIVRYLISEGWDVDAVTEKEGWTPMHYAASCGNKSAVTSLMEARCFLDCDDNNGSTPSNTESAKNVEVDECVRLLQSSMKVKNVDDVSMSDIPKSVTNPKTDYLVTDMELLKNHSLLEIIDDKAGKTVLDKLLADNNPAIIEEIRAMDIYMNDLKEWEALKLMKIDIESIKMVQECLMYRCIRHNFQEGFIAIICPDLVNRNSLFMGPTALELSVEYECTVYLKIIIPLLVQIDESWTRALNLAKKMKLTNAINDITDRMEELSRRKKLGFSRLHTAVFDNNPLMVEYLIDSKIVDIDQGHRMMGTALSLAYSLDRIECVKSLLKKRVNVNTIDRWGQTPLHVAISNKIEDYCDYLVENTTNLEAEDCMGYTALERAALNNCENICKKLLAKVSESDQSANIESRLWDIYQNPQAPRTSGGPIQSLDVEFDRTIITSLVERIDQRAINITDVKRNTLLHVCAASLLPDLCSQLILKSAKVSIKNNKGNTPLLELLQQNITLDMKQNADTVAVEDDNNRGACAFGADVDVRNELERNMIDTVNVLIDAGASVNDEDFHGYTVLDKATLYHNEKLLLALIRKKGPIERIMEHNLAAWFAKKHFELFQEIIPLIDESMVTRFIYQQLVANSLCIADLTLIKVIYDNSSKIIQKIVVEDILHKAVSVGDKKLFEAMIDDEMSADTSSEGESLLISLIRDRSTEFCRTTLHSRNAALLLEKKNSDNKLPLHICIETEYWDIIDWLISDTVSVDEEDVNGNTPLSLLLEKISKTDDDAIIDRLMSYIKMLISRSADIYKVNKDNRTVISFCTTAKLRGDIESFFQLSKHANAAPSMKTEPSTT